MGVMLAKPLEARILERWNTDYYIIQPKLNGLRCRVAFSSNGDAVTLYSSQGNIQSSVPHINAMLATRADVLNGQMLDGELYCHEMPLQDISSIVRRTRNLHPDFPRIEYHIFDVINSDPQYKRIVHITFDVNLNELRSSKMFGKKLLGFIRRASF